jgi:oligosaccharide repeat unit polymerase
MQRWNARAISRPGTRMRGPSAMNGYWWEDPARLMLFFILPLYVLISMDLLSEQKAIERVFFDSFYAFAGGLFLVIVMAVSYVSRTPPLTADRMPAMIPKRVLDTVFGLAFFGYLIMMGGVIAHPAIIMSFFNGGASTYDVLEMKGRVVGISTLTQAAVGYVPLYFYVFRQPERGFNRYKLYLLVLGVLTLLRSFIFAERLALIEVALPFALMYVRFRRGTRPSKLLALGPFAAIGPMIAFFIANEYHRSWETYYINVYDNIFDFAIERLALYYSTALNNGAGILRILGWGDGSPIFTLDWLNRFPVLGEFIQPSMGSSVGFESFLSNYGDPEFNNPSGIFVHFYEWGWFALFIAAFIGWVFGKSYSGWRSGDGFWCCAHSVLLVSLLEILRIPNLFSGRNFVPLALLFIVFRFFAHSLAYPAPAHTVRGTR